MSKLADFVRQAALHCLKTGNPVELRPAVFFANFPDDHAEAMRKATQSYIRNTANRMPDLLAEGLVCKTQKVNDDGVSFIRISLHKDHRVKIYGHDSVKAAEQKGFMRAIRAIEEFQPNVDGVTPETFPIYTAICERYRTQCQKLRGEYAPEQESESESD